MAQQSGTRWTRAASGLAVLPILAALSGAPVPAEAQETIQQFNAANAEQRRYADVQNQLNNQALQLRQDHQQQLLGCQGAGAPAACANTANIAAERQRLELDNMATQARDQHRQILMGIGVRPVP